jgi:hypothetical protein
MPSSGWWSPIVMIILSDTLIWSSTLEASFMIVMTIAMWLESHKNIIIIVFIIEASYKKRLASRINQNLLLKINLQKTWTLQFDN